MRRGACARAGHAGAKRGAYPWSESQRPRGGTSAAPTSVGRGVPDIFLYAKVENTSHGLPLSPSHLPLNGCVTPLGYTHAARAAEVERLRGAAHVPFLVPAGGAVVAREVIWRWTLGVRRSVQAASRLAALTCAPLPTIL